MDNRARVKPPPPHSRLTPHPSLHLLILLRVDGDPRVHKRSGSMPTRRLVRTGLAFRLREVLFQEVYSHLKEVAVEALASRHD